MRQSGGGDGRQYARFEMSAALVTQKTSHIETLIKGSFNPSEETGDLVKRSGNKRLAAIAKEIAAGIGRVEARGPQEGRVRLTIDGRAEII